MREEPVVADGDPDAGEQVADREDRQLGDPTIRPQSRTTAATTPRAGSTIPPG